VLFNEPKLLKCVKNSMLSFWMTGFSALQRAEIAEIAARCASNGGRSEVSVLFNEPKLLKSLLHCAWRASMPPFQCSSTSRNC